MTGTLTHLYEADLDGTGALVDITGYVASAGHWWGRRDWSAGSPAPGSLDLVLDNADGRFTPGNTSTYDVGCIDGVAVKWTTTGDAVSRVRWFKMGTPELAFPSGSAASSQVQVSCYDALAELQQRTLGTMLDEQVLLHRPYGYWRIDDSGSGLTPRPQDIAGNAVAQLVPSGSADAFGWAAGQGPAADAGGALHMYADAVGAPTGTARLATDRRFAGGPQWGSALDVRYAVGLWFTVRDVYASTDNPVVLFDVATDGGPAVPLVWDPADSGVKLAGLGTVLATVSPTRTHLLVVSVRSAGASLYLSVWVDGAQQSRVSVSQSSLAWSTPTGITLVSGVDGTSPLAGTVARLVIWPADALEADTGSYYRLRDVDQLWEVGQLGAPEGPLERATRIAGYVGLAVSAQGTDRGDLLGRQDTAGRSGLDAVCDALRSEDAALIAGDDGGPVLVPWLYSTQRPGSSTVTVDVEDDCHGVPRLAFDTSAVANVVTVASDSLSVTWRATDLGRWGARAVTVSSAQSRPADALALAQYRSLLGRIAKAVPSVVPVDAALSAADLRDALLGLRPGSRVLVSGLDAGKIGYSAASAFVVGCGETHDEFTALFELQLSPADLLDPVWGVYDGVAVATAHRLQASPDNVLAADISSSATLLSVAGRSNSPFSAATPYVVQIDEEKLLVSAVFGGSTLGVTRGVNGTTAAAHSAGSRITLPGTGKLRY